MWQVQVLITWLLIIPLLNVVSNEAARILVAIPTPTKSHQIFFRPLTQELVKRGHEVFVITTNPAFNKNETPANLHEIDVHDISYNARQQYFQELLPRGRKDGLHSMVSAILKAYDFVFENQMQSDDIQKIIQDKNISFDVLLIEASFKMCLIFSHLYKNIPVIQISSMGAMLFDDYYITGVPNHPLLYPSPVRQNLNNLTTLEEMTEMYNQFRIEYIYNSHLKTCGNDVIKRIFGPDCPTLNELDKNVNMIFINEYIPYGGNHPVTPTLNSIAGIHEKPDAAISQDLKSYLDSSTKGVIYMSFGTTAIPSLLPPEKIQYFVEVFSKLPYNILWKWDKDELPGQSENIKISKWFPQQKVLEHPNVKLLISHGGLHSIDEAIIAGVPIIGIPMSGDHWFNVEKMIKYGLGKKLDLNEINVVTLKHAIDKVVGDESYRHNILKLGELLLDQPQTALERAVWWTEYVIRHGTTDHLKGTAALNTWAEYFEIELICTVLFALIIVIVAVTFVGYCLLKSLRKFMCK